MISTTHPVTWVQTCFAEQNTGAEQAWLSLFRKKKLHDFLQKGFPTKRDERWKYIDLSALSKTAFSAASLSEQSQRIKKFISERKLQNDNTIIFINGHCADIHMGQLPLGLIVCSLQQALLKDDMQIKSYLLTEQDHSFAALNAALLTDGVFIQADKDVVVTKPIYCIYISTEQQAFVACPNNRIVAKENSQLKLIEEYVSIDTESYFNNVHTTIHAEANASVEYYKIQNEALSANHIAHVTIYQQKQSQVKTYFFSNGATLEREDVSVIQLGDHAETRMIGFYKLGRDHQQIDHHVQINHQASHGTSTMLYKGIVDKKSKAIFNGKVWVGQKARKICAHQANHNLMLSDSAEVNAKPELEIYADDVKCAHGVTIGKINEQSLFYLQSRGIPKTQALKIVMNAFFSDMLNHIADDPIKHYIASQVNYDEPV